MRCVGCWAWNGEKCLAGITPHVSKKKEDGVGCRSNTRTVNKRLRENGKKV